SRPVARPIQRPTRESVTDRADPALLFGLAPGGVCRASLSPGCWWALTLRDLRPPTISPLPSPSSVVRGPSSIARKLCHGLRTADNGPRTRRYPCCCTIPVLRRAEAPLRTVGVTHHRALWSPDFPLPAARAPRAATVRPACECSFHCKRAGNACGRSSGLSPS